MSWTDPAVWMTLPTSGGTGGVSPATQTLPVVGIPEADAYFATTPRDPEWQAVADKQAWLNEAQLWLGALCYDTSKDCCGNSFTAAYTRAVSELALALSSNPTAITGGGGGTSGAIKKAQLGGLAVEYFEGGAAPSRVSSSAPAVLQAFPWLLDVLGCWLKVSTGNSRILQRVRS